MTADLPESTPPEPESPTAESPLIQIPRADLLISLAILLTTVVAYLSVVRFGFVTLDDPYYVVQNAHLRDGLTLQNLRWIFVSFSPDYWFPVTRLSYLLDYNLFALRAGWYHAENVAIHALAAVLLFGFLRRATRTVWPCAFVAFVFALHPLHVESVAWVSERKDVLCAFFWFATLWAWLRYTEVSDNGQPARRRYVDALVCFSLGLMSKPMIVTLPFLLVLLDVWPLRRKFSRKLIVEKIPFAALSCAVMGMTYVAQRTAGAMAESPPLMLRVENALITVAIYVAHTVWPSRLSVLIPFSPSLPVWQAVAAAAGIIAVSAIMLRVLPKRAYLAVGWFWFLGTLLPVIGLVQVGQQARTDHFMYVPMVGLSIMLAWGATDFVARWPASQRWIAGLGITACLSLGLLTLAQIQYWRNTEELLRHAIEVDSGNYLAWDFLGQTIALRAGFPSEAASCFRNAIRARPDFAEAHNDLGVFLFGTGETIEAVAEYREAIQINPFLDRPHYNYGVALRKSGRDSDAVDEFRTMLRLNPSSAVAHDAIGTTLADTGRVAEGIAELEQAVRIDPDDALAQFDLGSVLAKTPGRIDESITHFTEALRVNPRYVGAHLRLASLLVQVPGRRQEAIAHVEAAEEIDPNPDRRRLLEVLKSGGAVVQ